ncbi:LysM peptidoglycan-binding domain-containing M23 family metallopeptidase [Streptomyces sp. NPDC095613]|uniref:LysM peptidoglycan-binding domain-containing M23 family metallopeptidase n=1 Tax=Streptomyces sp. NPDC095613 TaxID=3155540 RepID=UPI003332A92A
MPGKGKHRRPKTRTFSRGFAAAGTGGAAIALPFIAATGAHAAPKAAPATAPQAVSAHAAEGVSRTAQASATQTSTAPRQAAAAAAATTTYAVVAGDYLSKIADEHKVRGGWQKLYADNRSVVGDDPSLIHPGLELTIGGKSAGGDGAKKPSTARSEAPRASSGSAASAAEGAGKSTGGTAAKSAADTAAKSDAGGFTKPVDAPVSTPYRASGGMWSSGYHTGVDFTASSGTPVKAVGAGTVVTAGWGGSYGNEVVIKHDDGRYSQYGHLSSLAVSAGQSVGAGQQIGLSGATGNVTGPHLHFEIRTGPEYGSDVDPIAYLRQNGVSL